MYTLKKFAIPDWVYIFKRYDIRVGAPEDKVKAGFTNEKKARKFLQS